jgi:hypothetical protein
VSGQCAVCLDSVQCVWTVCSVSGQCAVCLDSKATKAIRYLAPLRPSGT